MKFRVTWLAPQALISSHKPPRTAMPLSFRVTAVLLISAVMSSCATPPYENATSGPVASIFLEADSRPDILPTIHTSASCSAPKEVPHGRWIVVPANGSVALRKPFPVGLGICNAEGRIDLREGDRVRVRFLSELRGLTMVCGMTATKAGPTGVPAEVLRVRKACGA